jgi:enolase
MDATIVRLHGRQILDSRGRPTVEVDVETRDGSFGRASAPSGASTGRYEALELRDRDPAHYEGRGVKKALSHVRDEIAEALRGEPVNEQARIDRKLIDLDGTPNLSRLGANAVIATSVAVARAGAAHHRLPLYKYLSELAGGSCRPSLPMPMTNILSGGAHAGRGMDFQDFLAVPVGARSYSQALEMLLRVRACAADLVRRQGLSVLLADEGGLAPGFAHADEALGLMVGSIEAAGLRPDIDVAIAIDVAASELWRDGAYDLSRDGRRFSSTEMIGLVRDLVRQYPVISVEDALDQDDMHWHALTAALPDLQIVGDDFFATNPERLAAGIAAGAANAVLVKINQNGTLTGTLDVVRTARAAGYATVVSARSGETEDAFVADLAVGTGAGQIKIGSVRNSERLAKYNELIRLEEDDIPFAGVSTLAGRPLSACPGEVGPGSPIRTCANE